MCVISYKAESKLYVYMFIKFCVKCFDIKIFSWFTKLTALLEYIEFNERIFVIFEYKLISQ